MKYLNNISSWVKFFLILICSFFSISLFAQVSIPTTYYDGNPGDWANFRTNYPINSYTFDVANATDASDDNYQSAKDVNEILAPTPKPQDWTWWLKAANDKGDITNAGAALIIGTNGGHTYLRFFGDRTDNSGACNIGFWFLKNDVHKVGTTSGKFSAGHQIGDLLVLVALEQGGTLAAPQVYTWTANGLVLNTTATTYARSGANQSTVTTIPAGFTGYTNKDGDNEYLKNSFFEGVIDLTAANLSSCFASFITETRQSPSTNAALEDFAQGSFNAVPDAPTPVNNSRCGPGTVTLTPTGCTGGVIQWYNAATGGTAFTTGSSYTTPSLTSDRDYYISCKVADCESPRVKITAIIKAIPTLSLKVVQPDLCANSTGSLEVCSPVVGSKYILGTTEKTAVAGQPVVFSSLAAGSNPSVKVEAANGCDATVSCSSATATCPTSGVVTSRAAITNYEINLAEEEPNVIAAPNPFNDKIRFSLKSAVSGQGSLELYNMMGQKVKTVFQGRVEKGKLQTIEYNVPGSQRANLIYLFRVGEQKTTGKLIGLQ